MICSKLARFRRGTFIAKKVVQRGFFDVLQSMIGDARKSRTPGFHEIRDF